MHQYENGTIHGPEHPSQDLDSHLNKTAEHSPMELHGVYKGILNGLHERGEGGVLYLRDNTATYIFPNELKNQNDLRDALHEMLESDSGKLVFFVVEEKEGKCHVLAYPRAVVRDAVAQSVTQSRFDESSAITEVGDQPSPVQSGTETGTDDHQPSPV